MSHRQIKKAPQRNNKCNKPYLQILKKKILLERGQLFFFINPAISIYTYLSRFSIHFFVFANPFPCL